jgi:hypothetical protein
MAVVSLVAVAVLLLAAAALVVQSFVRDDPFRGLLSVGVALAAAVPAIAYEVATT